MRRQAGQGGFHALADALQELAQLGIAHQVGHRVVVPRHDALAQHHLDP